jgi:hypothetical protein
MPIAMFRLYQSQSDSVAAIVTSFTWTYLFIYLFIYLFRAYYVFIYFVLSENFSLCFTFVVVLLLCFYTRIVPILIYHFTLRYFVIVFCTFLILSIMLSCHIDTLLHKYSKCIIVGWLMMFNATFNNISVISWWSVLLVEEKGVPGENHRAVASH